MEIKVKTNAKENKFDEENKVVYVKAKAENGKANLAVVNVLSKYFKKQVRIVKGFKSNKKVIDVK